MCLKVFDLKLNNFSLISETLLLHVLSSETKTTKILKYSNILGQRLY